MTLARRTLIQAEIDRRIRLKRQAGSAKRGVIALVGIAGVAFTMGRCLGPDPVPVYPTIEVPIEAIQARKPEPALDGIGDRIQQREVEPIRVATSTAAATTIVRDFCIDAARDPRIAVIGDSTPEFSPTPSSELVLAGRFAPPWFWGRGRLELFGIRPDGSMAERIHDVGAPFEFHAGNQFSVRESRFWWLRDVVRIGAPLTVGYVAGRLTNEE